MALVLVSAVVDGVVTLTLRRPEKKNALSIALRDELSDTLDALSSDGSVKVVARDLVLTGRRIEAREALVLGLVNRVVPEDRLLDEAASVAAEIALAPRDVLMRTKAKIIAVAAIDPDATTLEL